MPPSGRSKAGDLSFPSTKPASASTTGKCVFLVRRAFGNSPRSKILKMRPRNVSHLCLLSSRAKYSSLVHWRTLSSIFDALRQHPNIAPPLRCFQPDVVPFLPAPSPEKPLVTDFFFGMIVHVLALFMPEQQDEWSGGSTLSRKTRRPKSVTTIALRMDSDHDGLILRSSRPRISMRPYTRQRPLLASPDSDE